VVLNLVWDKLLPEWKPAALPADEAGHKKLQEKLKGLSLRPAEGLATAAKVWGKQFEFPANDRKLETLTLEKGKDGAVTLVARINAAEHRIVCGHGSWQKGRGAWGLLTAQPIASSGAWTEDDTFTARLCFCETPFLITLRLKFSGDEVRLEDESNVGFGPLKRAQLVGKPK
jgi:hypothetical protein